MSRRRKPDLVWRRRCRQCDSAEAIWHAKLGGFGECDECEFPYVPLIWPVNVFTFVRNSFLQGADDEMRERLGLVRMPRKGTGGAPRKFTAEDLKRLRMVHARGLTRKEIAADFAERRRSEVEQARQRWESMKDSRKWTPRERGKAYDDLLRAEARAKVSLRSISRAIADEDLKRRKHPAR